LKFTLEELHVIYTALGVIGSSTRRMNQKEYDILCRLLDTIAPLLG